MSAGAEVKPTLESIAGYVKKHTVEVKKAEMMHHGDPVVVREEEYKGHRIVIRTTYHIEVDGQSLMGHLDVTNEGQVHSHALPNYSFDSANALVERLIDTFPEDFTGKGGPSGSGTGDHSTTMGSMVGMNMSGTKAKAKPGKARAKAGKAKVKPKAKAQVKAGRATAKSRLSTRKKTRKK